MAGDVRYCNNCRRNIAASNFVIHSVHCERNIVLCSSCNEPVPRSEMAKHMEEFHTLDSCELCGEEMERFQMADHRDSCYKRPVPCKYCNLECPFDEAEEHQTDCGARTEKCASCKVYVKRMDQDAHKAACQRERRAKQLLTCEYCLVEMPTSLLLQHASLCGSETENCPQCFEPVARKDKNRHECKVACIPCEFCDTSIPRGHYYDHVSVCGLQCKNCLKCNASFMLKDRDAHICQSPSKSGGQCSVCHVTVPWVDLREHEAGCRLAAYSSGEEEEEKPKFSAIPAYQKRQSSYRQADSRPLKEKQETPTYLKMKQCPYCKERYPDLIVEEHSKECNHRSAKCEFCGKAVRLKDKQRHEKRECQMRHSTNYNYEDSENYLAGASGYTKEYEKRVKQCPYCLKKFPEIMFVDHQTLCEERPYQCNFCLKMMPMRNKDNHELKECIHMDRFQKTFVSSEDTNSKDVPVYKRSFEKDYLEKNYQMCPYCKNRIPEAKLADHVQCCAEGNKLCRFCGAEIGIDEEISHLNQCVARHEEDVGSQTSGGKKGKKKKKKDKQHEPDQPKGLFSSIISRSFLGRKPASPEKEYLPETYFRAQLVQLPCEFCNELFPDEFLIEHQSGCRPDLVSLPIATDTTTYAGDHRSSLDKDKFQAIYSDKKDTRNTGALPKRNRFHRDSAEGKPGEFLSRQSPPKEERDYFNYPSGVPEHTVQPDVVNEIKTTLKARDKAPENKTASYKMEKKVPSKDSATQLFNFSSSSSNKSSSCQPKANPTMFSYPNDSRSPTRQSKYSEPQKTELRAVGAERAERKGIIRDTSSNFEDGTPGKYGENFQIESNCDARLARLLSSAEPSDITEDDAKNDETFGSSFDPREPLSLSNEEEHFSDSFEHFYDAEDDLKSSNMEKRKSLKNGDLDAYVKYIEKDKDEMIASNRNQLSHGLAKEKVMNCNCGNRICYCGVLGNNNCSDTEENEGNSNDVESPNLSANRATNFSRKEFYQSNVENQISAKIKKRSPEFAEWRSKNIYSSDSE